MIDDEREMRIAALADALIDTGRRSASRDGSELVDIASAQLISAGVLLRLAGLPEKEVQRLFSQTEMQCVEHLAKLKQELN